MSEGIRLLDQEFEVPSTGAVFTMYPALGKEAIFELATSIAKNGMDVSGKKYQWSEDMKVAESTHKYPANVYHLNNANELFTKGDLKRAIIFNVRTRFVTYGQSDSEAITLQQTGCIATTAHPGLRTQQEMFDLNWTFKSSNHDQVVQKLNELDGAI